MHEKDEYSFYLQRIFSDIAKPINDHGFMHGVCLRLLDRFQEVNEDMIEEHF